MTLSTNGERVPHGRYLEWGKRVQAREKRVLRTPNLPPWFSQAMTVQSSTSLLSASVTLGLVWDCNYPTPGQISQCSFQVRAKPLKLQASGATRDVVVAAARARWIEHLVGLCLRQGGLACQPSFLFILPSAKCACSCPYTSVSLRCQRSLGFCQVGTSSLRTGEMGESIEVQ